MNISLGIKTIALLAFVAASTASILQIEPATAPELAFSQAMVTVHSDPLLASAVSN